MSEAAPQPVDIPYALRDSSDDALRAYQLIGIMFLMNLAGTFLAISCFFGTYLQTGIPLGSAYFRLGMPYISETIALPGAVGMVMRRPWGVWFIIAAQCVRVLLSGIYAIWTLATAPSFQGIFLQTLGRCGSDVLYASAGALIAYALWSRCQRRGAWGPNS